MFHDATLGIVVVNRQGKIVMGNPLSARLFGYTEKEMTRLAVNDLLPASLREKHSRHQDGYHQRPTPRKMGEGRDLFGLRKDGSLFPIEISLSATEVDGEQYVVTYISDITIRKTIADELISSRRQLEEYASQLENKVAERTQELVENEMKLKTALSKEIELGMLKSRFVAMASHEFRTPLSTILSSANLLEKYTESDQQIKRLKHIRRIESSVQNLTSILNDFLSLEKLETGHIQCHPQQINLEELLETIAQDIEPLKKTGQSFEWHRNLQHLDIIIDPNLLRNILLNLTSNAVKYSHPDGIIELHVVSLPNALTIMIRDHGIGIPASEQKHLFSRFFRASNATNIKGTGLGLTIVKRYVELMGGTIEVESMEGTGTTVRVEIV